MGLYEPIHLKYTTFLGTRFLPGEDKKIYITINLLASLQSLMSMLNPAVLGLQMFLHSFPRIFLLWLWNHTGSASRDLTSREAKFATLTCSCFISQPVSVYLTWHPFISGAAVCKLMCEIIFFQWAKNLSDTQHGENQPYSISQYFIFGLKMSIIKIS